MSHDLNTLGKRIRQARITAKMTQADVAKKMGVTRGALTQWESMNPTTNSRPRLERLHELASVLGVPLNHLLDGADMPSTVEAERERLQRIFWEACKDFGKTGEVIYLTYKARVK